MTVAWDELMSCLPGRFLVVALAFGLLSACGDDPQLHSNARHWVPLTPELLALMQERGMHKEDPILIRTYKQEAEFEVWKKDTSGRYALLKTFPMCRWSGQLGPKRKEGDRQAPEGYYAITPAQLNPRSNYHLSYDMGYPNAYDRAHGGTGSYLMVHGDCSSAGCYSMTDKQIEQIYALVREAQSGGQKAVQMEAFPFRFTTANLARHRLDPNMPFWRNLKEGADRFEITKDEPKVSVCNGRYAFDRVAKNGDATGCGADADPELTTKVAEKDRDDKAGVAELVAKGTPAVRIAYDDGGQHPYFRNRIAETSRPEAIAQGPTIELYDTKGALTKKAIQASGFDEASIATAVRTVASSDAPATTAATTPASGTKSASSVVAASTGTSTSAGSDGASAAAASVSARTSSSLVAKRGMNPASTSANVALAAPADSGATSANVASDSAAPANKEQQPFYSKLFSNLPKVPFTGSDVSPPPAATAVNIEPDSDAKAPAPPTRPVRLAKFTDKESAHHPGSTSPTAQSSASRANASRSGATRKNDPDSSGTQSSSPQSSPSQSGASQAANSDDGVDLFSSRPTYATLPTFTKGSGAKPSAPSPTPADQ
jgi:murein L,D-transpeptidase YafK